MSAPWWIALVLVLFVLSMVAVVVARRIDRLHRQVLRSRRALEYALTARAQYAHDFAVSGALDIAGAVLLADAADTCLREGMLPIVDDGLDVLLPVTPPESPGDRRSLESDLSRTLRLTVDEMDPEERTDAGSLAERLERARLDVRMTRSFHNSHVDQIRRLRRNPLARLLHLAGNAPLPVTVDIDDE